MRLTDLLQLINDLNINTTFYLKIDDKVVPWGKLTLVDGRCLLYPGEKAMTKAKLIRLVGHMHNRGIPLLIAVDQEEHHIFGLQIKEDNNQIVLM
ncbi:hypothetical protein [Lactobacillus gallinarum]|uniref:Uncharacterized protein n=1 Tax=Lactobacillus gallinarum DSM 10532 = JCM 2011 TaxID=1423748 RepID=A0A0R1NW53_9LACO|nr:hypothetical protein [Lactobacillus gallinarum]KRL21123.1 hypothetical protein FC37_GL001605 [Lactobacillus gallinarum DSM 10532 = JCM 2011]